SAPPSNVRSCWKITFARELMSTRCRRLLARVAFDDRLEIRETGLELRADHLVHVDEDADQFADIRRRTFHRPRHLRRVSLRHEREPGDVVSLERFDEIELDPDARRR